MANNGFTAAEIIEAVRGSKGFVSVVAKKLGCQRTYIYKLAEKFPTVKEAIEEEREGNKDFVEGKLMEQINVGNITAIIFYLKTQAKDRGYTEKQELEHSGEMTHNVNGLKEAIKEAWGNSGNDSNS